MEEKKTVSISSVIEMLEKGMKRPEIREELELSAAQMTALFKHPKLKGRKAKKPIELTIIDDWEEEETNVDEVIFKEDEPL